MRLMNDSSSSPSQAARPFLHPASPNNNVHTNICKQPPATPSSSAANSNNAPHTHSLHQHAIIPHTRTQTHARRARESHGIKRARVATLIFVLSFAHYFNRSARVHADTLAPPDSYHTYICTGCICDMCDRTCTEHTQVHTYIC